MPSSLPWNEIETVLFDMDGTLLDLHFDNHFWMDYLPEHYAERNGVTLDESKKELYKLYEEQIGKLNFYCLDYWSKTLNIDIMELKQGIKHKIQIKPYSLELLTRLKKDNYKVKLVTNAHRDNLDMKLAITGIGKFFEGIVVSHDYNLPKEEIEFWHQMQQQHPFNPEKTLFIDDNQTVLNTAERYGIKHLITLKQPDSQKEIRTDMQYPAFHHYDELMKTMPN